MLKLALLLKTGKQLSLSIPDELHIDAVTTDTTPTPESRVYGSIEELLKNEQGIDIAVIDTPVGYHAEWIIKSLQAGLSVICNGPLCLTSAAAWQIIETAKFCRKKVGVINSQTFEIEESTDKEYKGTSYEINICCDSDALSRFPDGGMLYAYPAVFALLNELTGGFDSVLRCQISKPTEDVAMERSGSAEIQMKDNSRCRIEWSSVKETGGSPGAKITVYNGGKINLDTEAKLWSKVTNEVMSNVRDNPAIFDALSVVEMLESIYKAAGIYHK